MIFKRKYFYDYSIVYKSWGMEVWIVNNDLYCGKRLELNKGKSCSIHRHEKKNETFFIHSGKVLIELEDEGKLKKYTLFSNDSVDIPAGVWHRFAGIENSIIYEFSTFHSDSDVERKESFNGT